MSKAATAPAIATNYVWAFPGAPVKVYVPAPVLTKLREHVLKGHHADANRCQETGGFLLGKIRPARVDITGFRPFQPDRSNRHFVLTDAERTSFRTELEQLKSDVVGYFRSDYRAGIRLSDEDMALINDLFSDPRYIFLVARVAPDGMPTAGFFFWDGGSIFRDATFLQFPLDERLVTLQPANDSPAPAPRTPAPVSRLEQPTIPVPTETTVVVPHSNKTSPYRVAMLVTLVGLLCIAGTYVFLRQERAQPQAAPSRPPQSSPLSLWASRMQNTMAITWDANAPVLANARIGMMTIKDGESQRELPLTKAQLQMSKLLYSPESDRLEVILEVFSAAGESTRESIIVAVAQSGVVVPQSIDSRPAAAPVGNTGKPPRAFTAPVSQPANAAAPTRESLLEAQPLIEVSSSMDMQAPEFLRSQSELPPTTAPRENAVPNEPGAQVQPAKALRQVKPVVPLNVAPMLRRRVELQVRVQVDANGNVTKAETVEPPTGMAQYLLANTLNAARRWTFEPARRNGVPLASEVVLRFAFGQTP